MGYWPLVKLYSDNTCFCHRYLPSESVTVERAKEPPRKDIASGNSDDGDELELEPDAAADDDDDAEYDSDDGNSS